MHIQEHKSQYNTINNNTRLTCRVSESRESDNGSTAGIKVADPVTDLVLRVTSEHPSSSPKSIFTTFFPTLFLAGVLTLSLLKSKGGYHISNNPIRVY